MGKEDIPNKGLAFSVNPNLPKWVCQNCHHSLCIAGSIPTSTNSQTTPFAPNFIEELICGDETAPFFGFLGSAAALVFSCMGAAYGTVKSGVDVALMGVMRPELVMKSIVPVVMAGVLNMLIYLLVSFMASLVFLLVWLLGSLVTWALDNQEDDVYNQMKGILLNPLSTSLSKYADGMAKLPVKLASIMLY